VLEFITTTLASAAVTAALLGAVAWLLRTWVRERLARAVEHEYARRLETLRAELAARNAEALERVRVELQKGQTLSTAATASFLAARAAAHDRTLDAVQQLWHGVLRIRSSEPSIVGVTSFLTADEIRGLPDMPQFKEALARLRLQDVLSGEIVSPEVEKVRPFVGEFLWSLFFGYRALVGRMGVLFAADGPDGKKGRMVYYLDDPGFRQLLESLLTPEELLLVEKQVVGAYAMARTLVEQKILLQSRKVIEGEHSAELALVQARRIISASEKALRTDAR
jgi:hypothetical protein